MRANQKLIASDGYEVLLFPLDYLYMTQDEGGSYSHLYTYSIDCMGWNSSGRVYRCPYYAPCTLKCVYKSSVSIVWQSTDRVHYADGTLDIVTINFVHDNDLTNHYIGEVIQQGNLIGRTGTAGNVTGDHVHINTARGTYQGFYDVGTGHYQLINATHVYDTMYLNDTIILEGYNHNWRTYDGGVIPPTPTPSLKKKKFPWFIYANKIRG